MVTAPPRLLIGLAERLIPPDAREAVLGDLWERYRSPLQFAGQALSVLPFLVFAQVIRRSSWPILGVQMFILFACLRGFAPPGSVSLPPPWARAGLPTLCAFLALVWHDAYRGTAPDAPPRAAWGEAMAVILGIGISQALTATMVAMAGLPSAWLLTWPQLLLACAALPVLCVFRSGSWLKLSRRPVRAESLIEEYDLFRTRVRRRNRIEVGAMVATLLVSAFVLAWSRAPVPAIVWATQSGFAILAVYLAVGGGGRTRACSIGCADPKPVSPAGRPAAQTAQPADVVVAHAVVRRARPALPADASNRKSFGSPHHRRPADVAPRRLHLHDEQRTCRGRQPQAGGTRPLPVMSRKTGPLSEPRAAAA